MKDNIYYDIRTALDRMDKKNCIVGIIIGGRGIGKTYSALKYVIENKIKHIYMRRSDTELQVVATEHGNPYKSLNSDLGTSYSIQPNGKLKLVLDTDSGEVMGYAVALSTFGNVRGADFSDVEIIVFDEFVPQTGTANRKTEGVDAFYNMYETVNRNRELREQKPVKVLMLSNAVSIASPILSGMGVVPTLETMRRTGQSKAILSDRHIYLEIVDRIAVSDVKAKTAFYQLCKGTDYYNHAINNDFAYDSFYNVAQKPIVEYTPICAYEDIYFYVHKSNGTYYATYTKHDCVTFTKDTKAHFMLTYSELLQRIASSGNMYYESYDIKKRVLTLLEL